MALPDPMPHPFAVSHLLGDLRRLFGVLHVFGMPHLDAKASMGTFRLAMLPLWARAGSSTDLVVEC